MKRKGLVLIIVLVLVFVFAYPSFADGYDIVIDGNAIIPYYWQDSWDANQNNAYIDLINGIYNGDTVISLQNDYINSTQLLNVIRRIKEEHREWETVCLSNVTYTSSGYVDSVYFEYMDLYGTATDEEIKNSVKELADITAFAKSLTHESMTDLEKVLIYYIFIAHGTTYRELDSTYGLFAGVFLERLGVCRNMADAFSVLLYNEQIPCASLSGFSHRWSAAFIDGGWYLFDTTFDHTDIYKHPSFDYFHIGLESHYEHGFECTFSCYTNEYISTDPSNIEFNDPEGFWQFDGLRSDIVYHIGENESHGKWYYLVGPEFGDHYLAIRDSLYEDAQVEYFEDKFYDSISSNGDILFAARDNEVFIIDWDTHDERLIGYLEDNVYYTVDENGNTYEQCRFENEERHIGTIRANNGHLSVMTTYTYEDTEAGISYEYHDEIIGYNYDKVSFVPESIDNKVNITGPSKEPDELLYSFESKPRLPYLEASISGYTDRFVHTNGYTFEDKVCDIKITRIEAGAFKDLGPDRLAGELTFNKSLDGIGNNAFENCSGISGALDLSHLTGDTGDYAFHGCSSLEKVILTPNRGVGQYTFADCTGLKSVENLDTVNGVFNYGFSNCINLSGTYDIKGQLLDYAFSNCINIEFGDTINAESIGEHAFENCLKLQGDISIPNCTYLGNGPFYGTGVTRLLNTDNVAVIYGPFANGIHLNGIMDMPSLLDLSYEGFNGAYELTAIRFTNPDTQASDINVFPYTTDVALFVVKDSEVENIIKDKWTYGENYWYIDDVIASGELDNGIKWTIKADGEMIFEAGSTYSGSAVISGYQENEAPWDEYKRFVQYMNVNVSGIVFGTDAIYDFDNLEKVRILTGSEYTEDAFTDCDRLKEGSIEYYKICIHEPGEPVREEYIQETCTTDGNCYEVIYCTLCGEELSREYVVIPATGHTKGEPYREDIDFVGCEETGRYLIITPCSKCGAAISQEEHIIPPLGHIWSEWYTTEEPTCTEAGFDRRDCQRDPSHVEFRLIDPLGHDWADTSYTWSPDNSSCTATKACNRDHNHDISETVESVKEVIKEASINDTGLLRYTAEFTNPEFEKQIKEVEIPVKEVESIEINNMPCLRFPLGSDLDVTGGILLVHCVDGTSLEIPMTVDMVSGFDSSSIGNVTLTVSYKNKSVTYVVEIYKNDIDVILGSALDAQDLYTVDGQTVTVKNKDAIRVGYYSGEEIVPIKGYKSEDGYIFIAPDDVDEIVLVLKGDVNLDGRLSNADATKLKAAVKGMTSLSKVQEFASDVNDDNRLSNADSTKLKAAIKGMTSINW